MSDPSELLLQAVQQGRKDALDELLAQHRKAVRCAVVVRMDAHLRSRVDPSDVVQEASLVVAQRIDEYLDRRPMGFHLWYRATALECLLQARRKHVTAECRAVEREVSIDDESAVVLAERLLPTPSQAYLAEERAQKVREAIDGLADDDREIILLRLFEDLGNDDAAAILNVHRYAASKRFARAMLRLRDRLLALGLTG